MQKPLNEVMAEVYLKANTDPHFRRQLLDNPVQILSDYGVAVCDPERLLVEYNEGYGIFIGLPKPTPATIEFEDMPQATMSTLNECLHH